MVQLIKKFLLVGVVTFLLLFSACGGKNQNGMSGEMVETYSVLTLKERDITLYADYPATIEGRQNVEIRPKIDGFIDAIYVDEGDAVKKGQLLFRISNPQYEETVRNAEASIGIAQVAVETAQLEYEKVKPLVEKNIVSQFDLQSAKLDLASKKAELVQSKTTLANAKTNLNYLSVTSPANGVIGLIPYKIGALVSSTSTEPLATVSDISTVYAYFSFNEKQLLEFSRANSGNTLGEKIKGMPAVSLILTDGTIYEKEGKMDMISGLIDTETGSASIRASFPNPSGLMRSGGSATVRIPRNCKSVIVIPQSATTELQNKRFAYTIGTDNKVKRVPVTTTASSDGQYFIVTNGLKTGDRIVLEGVSLLKENAVIKAKEADASSIYKAIN